MLQTKPPLQVFKSFFLFCFKSPRECYKHYVVVFDMCLGDCVSSPQGNATNDLPNTAYLRCPTWFQVPKGMLQTQTMAQEKKTLTMFQVPKGMLQTYIWFACWFWIEGLFQVPKGMLQTKLLLFVQRFVTLFQVPKGMLQTLKEYYSILFLYSFKSPRECYKPKRGEYADELETGFKSPRECYKHSVASIPVFVLQLGFKSPRECYKPKKISLQKTGD